MKETNVTLLLILLIIGALIGTVVAEIILLIPLDFLTKIFSIEFPIILKNTSLDLKFVELNFGFRFTINIGSVGGIVLGFYLYRWLTR